MRCGLSDFIDFLERHTYNTILTSVNTATLLHNAGLALLAILIPFAIAVIGETLTKKRNQEADFSDLDLHVMLDHVFRVKRMIIYAGLIFVPPIFWDPCLTVIRFLLLLVWAVGLVLMARVVFDLYLWTKGNTNRFRFEYLRGLRQVEDLRVVWRSVWRSQGISLDTELRFLELFESTIERFMRDEQGQTEN